MLEDKEHFVITGLGGKRALSGEIEVRGSKNAALPIMASAPLFKDGLSLTNVPNIEDTHRMNELFERFGFDVVHDVKKRTLGIKQKGGVTTTFEAQISKKMRASILLTGPMLARHKKITFPHPGGCVIGSRPIDLFVYGFEKMGAKVKEGEEAYVITAPKGLKGADIFFKMQSVTATETFVMAAVLASGTTVLKNCSVEPEVVALTAHLKKCGADIEGIGTHTLKIKGGKLLRQKKATKIIPDRLEAGSFLIIGALCAKDLKITNCNPEHIEIVIKDLVEAGVPIEVGKDWIRVKAPSKKLKPFNIKTHEYPGFPTDLQAPMVVFLTQADGEASVFETIFEGRLNFTEDLVRMGADIKMHNPFQVSIKGKTDLKGKELDGPDIRAGLAYIVAALVAKGGSIINNVYYIDRGYERIEQRLADIGAPIQRA